MPSRVLFVSCLLLLGHGGNGQDTCHDINTGACGQMETSDPNLCNTAVGESACPSYCGKCPTAAITTTTPMPTRAPCEDLNTAACEQMHRSQPDLCSDPNIAESACPRFCGQCPVECYSCSSLVRDLSDCNSTVMCDVQQECYSMEVFDFDKSHGFRAGCMSKDLCIPQGAPLGQPLIGRRSSSTVHLKCCDSDRCNTVPGPVTTTVAPTTAWPSTTTTAYHQHHSNCHDYNPIECPLLQAFMCKSHPLSCRRTCGLCN